MTNAFNTTRNMFIEATGYTKPLSYDEWMKVSSSYKSAVLFVQFYDQITLAWYKTKSFFVEEELGVETMLQYLEKNVPLLEANSAKFTPHYIYTVAYNCLYCISHDIKRDIQRYENEISNIVRTSDDELDLFDTIVNPDAIEHDIHKKMFWDMIENFDLKTQKVVYHLLNGESLRRTSKRSPRYATDPLRDISVSVSEMETILEELKVKLSKFSDMF